MTAIKAVKGTFGREEAKTALVGDNDTGGSIRYFDDIGSGHVWSIAGFRRSCLTVDGFGFVDTINNRRRSPPRRSDGACGVACHSSTVRLSFALR
ncbi:hypothetical protein N2603_39555 [Bradyrhizobium huanghuaihaiense]|uniref:hypothetical protein n=1 Tax=Bradyrhizobium huanghuaihaiense TaxID=990078 RepID=UPI0021A9E1CB|nr:hypothetical protein [Bradyrhizobium sp. CB3035]UWU81610.1 hypothetical protein N2603_39555 [Bradyrhizobium sp. CB3035]